GGADVRQWSAGHGAAPAAGQGRGPGAATGDRARRQRRQGPRDDVAGEPGGTVARAPRPAAGLYEQDRGAGLAGVCGRRYEHAKNPPTRDCGRSRSPAMEKPAGFGRRFSWCSDGAEVPSQESGLDLVLPAKACAFDDNRLGVVEQPIQDGRGDGAIVVEDAGPLFEGFVSSQHDGATFVTLADDLEEQVGAVLVDGKIAELIEHQ